MQLFLIQLLIEIEFGINQVIKMRRMILEKSVRIRHRKGLEHALGAIHVSRASQCKSNCEKRTLVLKRKVKNRNTIKGLSRMGNTNVGVKFSPNPKFVETAAEN